MTYSGVLMLTTCAAVARLTFTPPAIALAGHRRAGVAGGAGPHEYAQRVDWDVSVAICVLLAIRNWRLVIVVPIVATLALVVAPGLVKKRAASIFDTADPANRDRMVMWKIGADMVRDHPVFGVGPHHLPAVYADYRQKYPEAVNLTNPHLHNVPIQIAAERGLPALAAWLWFVVVAARDLWRQVRARLAPAVAGAGLAALVAMLAAGMFEYNFGDSEFLMLFLGLITLPTPQRARAERRVYSPRELERNDQCRKCRRPVNTIARPYSSAAAITSASRIEPPGWTTAVAPAVASASRPSRNGKNASDATTDPPDDRRPSSPRP
jgi:hypothetical protein